MDGLTYFKEPDQQGWRDVDGNLHGEYFRFNDDGSVKMVAHYARGYRSGLSMERLDENNWEVLIWKDHCISQVVYSSLEENPEELIGIRYMLLGR